MEIKDIFFATEQIIKQPKNNSLIHTERNVNDHILGGFGVFTGPAWVVLQPDGQWNQYQPQVKLQRDAYGDTYCCVAFSLNNCHEFLFKKIYNLDVAKSDRFLGVGSGTIPGQGNSKSTVAEWNRTHGFVYETEWPFTDTMTIIEFYSTIPQNVYSDGLANLQIYEFGYKWLADNKPETIKAGLTFSPVQVDVENYVYNGSGYIANSGTGYVHEVIIFGYEEGKCWYVFDSENLQWLKFDWNYQFQTAMIHSLKKKNMFQLIKEDGQSAVYLQVPSGNLYGIADGDECAGGDLLKTFSGTYGNAGIKHVSIGTLDKTKIVGTVATRKDLIHSIFN